MGSSFWNPKKIAPYMTERRRAYPFHEIEPKWQLRWETEGVFQAANPGQPGSEKPKLYILDMFPYPSGAGLHVGHPEGYTATDIVSRFKRMRGYNVLHPMGWDAFGLPAEQYAVQTGTHPRDTTRRNIETFRRQIKALGFSYDWSREIDTTDPRYYKWTQWIFMQLYRRDLAYVSEAPVWYCPELGTVLANEEVLNTPDGPRSERGNHPVERRPFRQWMLRITAYAERLLKDLDDLDWPESLKEMQRNWIGRSEGARVRFKLEGFEEEIEVFTTRPDTLFGATYMVLAPEHPLVETITTAEQKSAIEEYIRKISAKTDLERTDLAREKSGCFTGAHAVNPVNGERIPVWIADYVLLSYGTGAIMAVPAHDQRDYEFARQFDLPIRKVVVPERGMGFQPLTEEKPILKRKGSHLPHWTQRGATYAITFRLADSLPVHLHQEWKTDIDKARLLKRPGKKLPIPLEHKEFQKLFSKKFEAALDAGHGECWLRREEIAEVVANALKHFDGERYRLLAWCVMPNHVHAVLQPMADHPLSEILHSWKSFTARKANEILQREGPFWQGESYDHLVRDETDLENQVEYVMRNPEVAGLENWRWLGGCGVDGLEAHQTDHGLEAHATVGEPFTGEGWNVNSDFLDDLPTAEAKAKITNWLEEQGLGRGEVQYKLRDWLFSRQRYWGEPFPVVWNGEEHCLIDESELPLELPEMENFRPTEGGLAPLAQATDWVERPDGTRREVNTMPQWAGSCWYYLRYLDPDNEEAFVDPEVERYWMQPSGVDLYVGGAEHAVLHLLYSRFWHKVLFDLGLVSTSEPFHKLVNQGLILGEDGQKMSKSRGNVVNPDDVIEAYGADAMRLFEMFMGPLEQAKPWSMTGVEGVYRFLARVWRLVMEENQEGRWELSQRLADLPAEGELLRAQHGCVKKVGNDIETLSFNTAIAEMMKLVNLLTGADKVPVATVRVLLQLLNPFAPHLTEELWERLNQAFGGGDALLAGTAWPEYEESVLVESEVELVVQVNGKVRDKLRVARDESEESVREKVLAQPRVQQFIGEAPVRKVIVVPGRLVNVVAK